MTVQIESSSSPRNAHHTDASVPAPDGRWSMNRMSNALTSPRASVEYV